ncbi:Pycsar system effector family protein [Lewinella sp. IMCC34191]|uniref:Pycsar system effector family protein n=1 Tax=Lewinella sp. IMCC34191 TaxID=2259172 RepID=UPI000E276524|nr:Pycsar system effector family protein [Lewinella sp. IMCC34191]
MSKEEKAAVEEKPKGPKKETVLDRAAEYVRQLFNHHLDPMYLFHNFAYSQEIADKAELLATIAKVDDHTKLLLQIAGLFYPVGYIDGPENFTERSAEELRKFSREEGLELNGAEQWIIAVPEADNDSEQNVRLLHDAVWNWLGRKRYDRRSDLLQLEREAIDGKEGDPVVFGNDMQAFLLNFDYLTDAGKQEFDKRRRKNVAKQQSSNYKIQQKEVKAKTGKNFGRGIDTMYRTAFRNHINLSRIADDKANMMISINTIILSILIAVSGAGLSFFEDLFFTSPEFLAPIIILLMSSLTAVVFAVFSARPKVTEYRIKKTSLLESKEASLLYFGNFLKIEKSDFIKYLSEMKMNQDSLYDDLARDLYDLGQVLHRKYLLLTISYNTFIGGLALAVITFLSVYIWNLTNMQ